MNLVAPAYENLNRLLAHGLDASTRRLAQMSHASWRMNIRSLQTAPVDANELNCYDNQMQEGAYFSLPGAAFFVLCPEQSSSALISAFLPEESVRLMATPSLQSAAFGEIASSVVGVFADTLSNSCDMPCITSAPTMLRGRKEQLLLEVPRRFAGRGYSCAVMAYINLSSPVLPYDCSLLILLSAGWSQYLRRPAV